MTIQQVVREKWPAATDKNCDDILWAHTAYPFCDVRTTYRQLRSAARAFNGDLRICQMCGMKYPYHIHGCDED